MIVELALKPGGGDEQFRGPGLLAKETCGLAELGGGKRLREVAYRDQVTSLACDIGQHRVVAPPEATVSDYRCQRRLTTMAAQHRC
jgi:hypothetical protein